VAAVSRKAALACLDRLCVFYGLEIKATRSRDAAAIDPLSVSGLIDIATERGLQARPNRLEWQALQTAAASNTILLLLRNKNVIAILGKGFHGADEIVAWNPLSDDDEIFYMPRGDLERVWNGDVLIVAPLAARDRSFARKLAPTLAAASDSGGSPRDALQKKPSADRSFLWLACLLCLCAVVGSGSLLFYPTIKVAISEAPWGASSASSAVNISPAGGSSVGAQERHQSTPKPDDIASIGALPPRPIASPSESAIEKAPPEMPPATSVPALNAPVPAAAAPQAVLSETGSNRAGQVPSVEPAEAALIQPAVANAGAAAPPEPAVRTSSNSSSPISSNPSPAPAEPDPPAGGSTLALRAATAPSAGAEAGPTRATAIETASRQTRRASTAEIAALLSRGDSFFGSADITSARLFYERAAEAGDAQAALRLGQTYDPSFLVWAHLGSRGNLALAQHWYQRARDLGASEAEVLLQNVERTSKP